MPGVTSGSGMVLAHDIRVIGETGNPADVEIVSDVAGRRTFTLGHSDAAVSNVTVSGSGCGGKSGPGGHFNMSAGRIENCIIREGYSSGHGGNVYMTGGRLVRCQVLSGHITGGGAHGGGVYASGGVVESCLIRGNYGVGSTYTAGMELLNGAVAINCTVIGNYGTVKEAVSTYRAIAERDLLGKPRAHGTALDLGCIESEQGCYLFVK